MTIAAGFICTDGIVLGADTKESYGEAGLTYVDKLLFDKFPNGAIGIAGSGVAYPLDYIYPRILDLFKSHSYSSLNDGEQAIAKLLVGIHASKEFKNYPVKDDLPTQFLIALHIAGKTSLLISTSTLLTPLKGAKVVGAGFMQQMVTELGQKNLTVEQASIAALYLNL
jgi:hypothetical protein